MKQVIVVRNDVKMSAGKLAAQCCHASVSAALKSKKKILGEWAAAGQKKIILQSSLQEMLEAKQRCDRAKLVSFL
ncbi:MAG: peptidyl-tRNA hydrolase, partial [Candidatus Aenigmarchaeota archaeon]|nr:peptidyl-tRNA hydrolase [Candidatus Aenigmarchaeota archaeon]